MSPASPEPRTLRFAGRKWRVKRGRRGPGNNRWSDAPESVWVDAAGRLHLAIRRIGGAWHCAEVCTEEFTTPGLHRFYVTGRIDRLDPNVVFSPFIYADDDTEVDIEFSRWGDRTAGTSAQYVIQPHGVPGNRRRFALDLAGSKTTHCFDWQPHRVRFRSLHGHYAELPGPSHLIQRWRYSGGSIPRASRNLRVHINLWLVKGSPPTDGAEVEVVVERAELPLPKRA